MVEGLEPWLKGLPSAVAATVRRLMAMPVPALAELQAEIGEYEAEIRAHRRRTEFVDVETASGIARGLRGLLADWATWTNEQRQWISMAVRYFVLEEDAESDLESVLGFEDDAQVFNVVAEALERSELKVMVG